MTEKEIIKECNELARNEFRELANCWDEEYAKKAVQGLLDLYNKEKEKNKELELCLKSEEKYSEGLNRDIKSLLNIEPNSNFISKDKIKQEIKELKENEDCTYCNNCCNKYLTCTILQQLLEE
jgi:hypothetical protein